MDRYLILLVVLAIVISVWTASVYAKVQHPTSAFEINRRKIRTLFNILAFLEMVLWGVSLVLFIWG